ncbi:MAG: hypothetical protein OXG39_06865 [Chloroflexi bacterium]|nr:hypothetical protein [Chloroflexota bacterium]
MRLSLIASLIALLMTIPASHSQSDYPRCSTKYLQAVLATVPAYEALRSTASSINSLEDALDYAEEQLSYRSAIWNTAPRCAESIDFFWQTTREAGYIAAYWAMHYGIRESSRGNPDFREALNPFIDPLDDAFYPEKYSQTVSDLRDLLHDDSRKEASTVEGVSLPACSEPQLAGLAPLLPEYQGIIADSKEIASIDDLLDLAHRQYAWRENWAHESQLDVAITQVVYTQSDGVSDLPPCREAVELLWLMYRAVNDVVTGTALIYAGFAEENHPYFKVFNRNADRVDELARLIENSEVDPSAPLEDWPICTKKQRINLENSLPAFEAFTEALSTAQSAEDLITIGKAEIAWRQSLWSHEPACAKDIEKILMLSQAASNIVAAMSFATIGVPEEADPYMEEVGLSSTQLDTFPLVLRARSIVEESPLYLQSCSDADFGALSRVVAQYQVLDERMFGFGGMERLLPLLDYMIEWRDNLLVNLPDCNLAFEMGLQMSHIVDDYAAFIGLVYAEAPDDSIPYLKTFAGNRLDFHERIRGGAIDLEAGPPLWRHGGQLPACSKEETSTVSAALGEYQALIESARRIRELDDLLDFGAAQVEWREGSWRNLPACAEALELGLLLHGSAGDYFSLYAFQVRQDSLSQTISGGHSLGKRLDEILAEIPGPEPADRAYPNTDGLPRCSVAETDRILGIISEFQAMLELASSYTRWGGFQEYIDGRIELREKVKAEMPDCLIGLDLTLTIAQNVASSLVQLVPGVGSADMANSVLQEQLTARIAELGGESSAEHDARPYDNNFPACSEYQLIELVKNSALDPAKLRETIIGIGRAEASFWHIDKEFAKYEDVLSELPRCAEALQIAMLFRQILGDGIASTALERAGADEIANLYPSRQADLNALQSRFDEIADAIARRGQSEVPSSQEVGLPRCTNEELATLLALIKEYQVIVRLGINSESIEELLPYIKPHQEWRADFWARLPGCTEAFEAGLPTTRASNNFVAYDSFELIGYPVQRSEFGRQIAIDSFFMFNWLNLLDRADRDAIDAFLKAPFKEGI